MDAAALIDIDGTLIDSNLLYVLAWRRAFQRIGKQVDSNTILHKIGMGGDKLIPAVLGNEAQQVGEHVHRFYRQEFHDKGLIEHVEATPGAAELLRAFKSQGIGVALASSAQQADVERYLEQLGGRKAVDVVITHADVSATKPDPDLFLVALEQLGQPKRVIVIGDSVYDIEAARTLSLPCIGVLTGGIERQVLEHAGAVMVFESPAAIVTQLETVLPLFSEEPDR